MHQNEINSNDNERRKKKSQTIVRSSIIPIVFIPRSRFSRLSSIAIAEPWCACSLYVCIVLTEYRIACDSVVDSLVLFLFSFFMFIYIILVFFCIFFLFHIFNSVDFSLSAAAFVWIMLVFVCSWKYAFGVAISQTIKTIIKGILNYFVATRQNLQNI